MTFTVVQLGGDTEKVVGTVWADAEAEARTIASDLHGTSGNEQTLDVRRTEERELPLKPFN
jgi:hypothetical protein